VRVQDEPSRRRGLALRKAGREIPPSAADAHLSRVALILIAAAGAVLAWSRFMMLTQSLSGDEVFSIVRYVQPGPSGIWNAATWLPNDHMLFELLTWITTHVLGSRHEPVYRLWGVFPAIAAAALLTWWLWTRREPLAAALFAAFASVAPMLLDLGTQARGYGLTFLAGALVLVGADRLQRSEEHGLLLFSVGGLIGMLTLENFVGLFVGSALALMLRPALRRRVLFAVILTGLLTAAWYAPVLSKSFGYENPHGHPLPWYGFVQAPLRDLLGAQLNLLVPSLPVTAGAAIAAGVSFSAP
jgi:hypothetical protein